VQNGIRIIREYLDERIEEKYNEKRRNINRLMNRLDGIYSTDEPKNCMSFMSAEKEIIRLHAMPYRNSVPMSLLFSLCKNTIYIQAKTLWTRFSGLCSKSPRPSTWNLFQQRK